MISNLVFIHKDLWGMASAVGAVLLICFVYKEWKLRNEKAFIFRLLAAFIALGSLLLLVLQPAKMQEIAANEMIVLTDGYNQQQLDSILKKNKKTSVLKEEDLVYINTDAIQHTTLLGYGVAPYNLHLFQNNNTTYIPSKSPSGIIKLHYKTDDILGATAMVKGIYHQAKNKHRLVFADPGGNSLDSLIFNNNTKQEFELQGTLHLSGNLVYQLIEKDSTGSVINIEALPIRVREKKKMQVLMLNTFPTFESKYLKNFLADKGHPITVRNQLTTNKYKFEYLNTEHSPIYRLTKEQLESYSILILTAETYASFSTTEKNEIDEAVNTQGLGVFVLPNASYFSLSKKASHFTFLKDNKNALTLKNESTSLPKYPYEISYTYTTLPIKFYENQNIGAVHRLGIGKIGITTLQNTYELILEGKNELYTQIWTNLLDHTVKTEKNTKGKWLSTPNTVTINEPYSFTLQTSTTNPGVKNGMDSQLPLIQDVHLPQLWHGTDYPKEKGWNTLTMVNDSITPFYYYVYDSIDRLSIKHQEAIEANTRYFSDNQNEIQKKMTLQAISPIFFYILFLLSIGYLWLAPKL